MPCPAQIRPLTPADAAAHRTLMLAAYAREPEAFTSTAAERAALPLSWWAQRLAGGTVWGAWDGERLLGAVGLEPATRTRQAHRATVFGMVVDPAARGLGLGRALLQALVDGADRHPGLALLELTVSEGNDRARRLYEDAGFVAWGREPQAVALDDGRRLAKWHLQRPLHGPRRRLSLTDAEVAEVRREGQHDGAAWWLRLSAAPVQQWQDGRWQDGHLGPVRLRLDTATVPDALPRLWGRLREGLLHDAQGQRHPWLELPGSWHGPLRLSLQDGHGQALELALQGLCLQCPPDAVWRESLHC